MAVEHRVGPVVREETAELLQPRRRERIVFVAAVQDDQVELFVFRFFDLRKDFQEWSQQIESMKNLTRPEQDTIKKNFIDLGYDIKTEAKKLEGLLRGDD